MIRAAAVSDASSQQMLEELERANLFVVPLDEERHWYRYHHLFADVLRQRLARSATPRCCGRAARARQCVVRAAGAGRRSGAARADGGR